MKAFCAKPVLEVVSPFQVDAVIKGRLVFAKFEQDELLVESRIDPDLLAG